MRRIRPMTRFVCAGVLLAVLAGPAPAQPNPLPASGVEVGSTFTYSGIYYIAILGYGWMGNVPHVVIGDSFDGSTYTVFMGGEVVSVSHPTVAVAGTGNPLGPGFGVLWDDTSGVLGISLMTAGGLLTLNDYGPIPVWEIPAS
jgi:hypothetical protein